MQGEQAGWGYTQELLAQTVDRLGEVSYLLRAAWFKGKPDLPQPVPRPGGNGQAVPQPKDESVRFSTREEIRAFFQGPSAKAVYSQS